MSRPGLIRRFGPIHFGVFFITVAAHVRAPLLPEMGRELDMSATQLGGFMSSFALGRILADIPAGRLTDHRPARLMLAVGAFIVAGSGVLGGLAPNVAIAFVAAFLLGVGSAWTNTTGIAASAEAPKARRGMAMAGFAAALMVGQAIGPAFGGLAASVWDWRVAFVAAAGIALMTGTALLLRSERSPLVEVRKTDDGRNAISPAVLASLYLLPALQFGVAAALIQTLAPIVGDAELSLNVATIGVAIGLGGLFRLVGAMFSGYVSDRYSRRLALFPGLVLQFAAIGVFAAASNVVSWWLAIILFSLGSTAVNVGATVLADLSEGGRLGSRLGLFRVTGDAALFAGPLAAGAIYDAAGRAWATLPLLLFAGLVIVFAFLAVPETSPATSR